MALVLEISKGEGFYVENTLVTVEEIISPARFKVLVHKPLPVVMEIGNKMQTELLPDVYAQAGRDQPTADFGETCKIAIDAPRSIKILRESLYHRSA